jgi:CRISPR-associated protein (TIGR03984 family)
MTTLYGCSQSDISLQSAIENCQGCFGSAVGLFYSPESCALGQVASTQVTDSRDALVNLDRVFEARIFNADYELRWLNDRSGLGTAVLLSETPIDNLAIDLNPISAIETQPQTYLLWGEGLPASLASGWSRLATSRLGKLDVPIAGVNQKGQRVRLKAIEYFQCLDDLYGNVVVAEERLTGFTLVI